MEWFSKAFVKSSLLWLGLGVTLGVAMGARPAWAIYRTAHLHMNLLGFVAMMIFGVAYHVIPRFSGHPLHSRRLAGAHWAMSNVGLALMAAGFAALPHGGGVGRVLVPVGGMLSAGGAYAFIYNLWRTIDGRAIRSRVIDGRRADARMAGSGSMRPAPVSAARQLPLADR